MEEIKINGNFNIESDGTITITNNCDIQTLKQNLINELNKKISKSSIYKEEIELLKIILDHEK